MKRIFINACLILNACDMYSQIGIGTTSPDLSSIVDISSKELGLLIPRLNTMERDAIVDPATGLIIYNIDKQCIEINYGTKTSIYWECLEDFNSSIVKVDNSTSGFQGNYLKGNSLTASDKFSVTIVNNSFNSSTINFITGDLVLSEVSGITVSSVSPTSATITSGDSLVVEYTLTGTPEDIGTLTGIWTKIGLNCTKSISVTN